MLHIESKVSWYHGDMCKVMGLADMIIHSFYFTSAAHYIHHHIDSLTNLITDLAPNVWLHSSVCKSLKLSNTEALHYSGPETQGQGRS